MNTMTALAAGVAAALGEGWNAAPAVNDDAAYLRHADGRELFMLRLRVPRGMAEVRGTYPGQWRSRESEGCSIRVGAGREPAAIARDITRRLLPRYGPQLALAREAAARDEEETAERERVAAAILALVPGSERDRVQPWSHAVAMRLSVRGYRRNAKVVSAVGGVTVDLDLRGIPAADALRMLAALGSEQDGPVNLAAVVPVRRRWFRLGRGGGQLAA